VSRLARFVPAAGDTMRQFAQVVTHLGEVSWATFAVGVTGEPGAVATFPDLDSAVSWARQGARGDVTPAR
jgi:hypothetical protein